MAARLGIDTGGTYTDAVIIDEQQRLLASCKSLTTRHDLSIGIGAAISGLPDELLSTTELISLSTTLTTNSVVEGQGAPVCVLLPGYNEQQILQSRLHNIVAKDAIALLAGGHDATGKECAALDLATARQIILAHKDKVSAFAISAMFGTRNTRHELQLRTLVQQLTSKPVACGHELTASLGAPKRALTVALNARMLPYIKNLICAVEQILHDHQIHAPLMIVKGDGSLVNTQTASEQPVTTVLSGPAASVVGACALSGLKNAVVADMGGTTTDIAIVSNGQPELCAEGARVGDWYPMVEAVRIYSISLGGDSEVNFNSTEGLGIGPRRVLPMCLLGMQHPWIISRLQQQLKELPNARNNHFVTRLETNEELLNQLQKVEMSAWKQLEQGPIELDAALNQDRNFARALAKLQRMGLAIYSGFTPSDAAHVLGLSDHWCQSTAALAAKIWARQFRQLYGIGNWKLGDTRTPCKQVFDLVVRKISRTLIEAGLHQSTELNEIRTHKLAGLVTDLILNNSANLNTKALFKLDFAKDYPIVAVGAPAGSYYPDISESLGISLHLPEHGAVANAVGAVMGSVVQRAKVTISQPAFGEFFYIIKLNPDVFDNLDAAVQYAQTLVRDEALHLAKIAGAESAQVELSQNTNQINDEIDGELFLDCEIIATATGRPNCQQLNLNPELELNSS